MHAREPKRDALHRGEGSDGFESRQRRANEEVLPLEFAVNRLTRAKVHTEVCTRRLRGGESAIRSGRTRARLVP